MSGGVAERMAARRARATHSGVSRKVRPDGSWGAAISRAVASWDELTGGPPASGVYSEIAAGAILAAALGLWPDTAARMGPEVDGGA